MSHYHHAHNFSKQTRKVLTWALMLNGLLLIVEAIVGYMTDSLALLSDAAHMVSDVGALAVALGASYLASRPATLTRSFGFSGAEVLGALINAGGLIVACFLIFSEAVDRLYNGIPEIQGLPVLIVGVIGLLINLASVWWLAQGDKGNLNVKAALAHMLADALGSLGAIAAAVLMLYGIFVADLVISVIIGVIIITTAYGLLKECFGVLLSFAPDGVDVKKIEEELFFMDDVENIHDLHVWSTDGRHPLLSVHIETRDDFHGSTDLLQRVRHMLYDKFNIVHTTIQLEKVSADNCGQENCI